MPSHYSSIGFDITSAEQIPTLAERVRDAAVEIRTPRGTYLRWTCGSGAELWLQVNRRLELVGMHPHFAGTTGMHVRIDAVVRRDNDTVLDGAYHAWANEQEHHSGDYPFVFDCANFGQVAGVAPPAYGYVRLSAFAYEAATYDSPEHFDASQDGETKFASRSFFPSGTFDTSGEPAQSTAMFTGHVLAAGMRHNEITGRIFHWARVETYAATLDVVADPAILPQLPAPGGVLSGTFWLTGVVEESRSHANRLKQLWWRARNAG